MSMGLMVLLLLGPIALGLWAQWRVKSTFRKALLVPAAGGASGAETAQMILDAHGLRDVRIEESHGTLSDHYDPRAKVVRLSHDVFHGRSVAAAGIAAHEVGHAIQDATRYGPLVLRNGIVPLAAVGSNAGMMMIFIGMLMGAGAGVTGAVWLAWAGVALFSAVVLFQIVNLPVEFDASKRARELLYSSGLVQQGGAQSAAMDRVLSAAAMTYVAATVGAVATLLYYVLMLAGNREE